MILCHDFMTQVEISSDMDNIPIEYLLSLCHQCTQFLPQYQEELQKTIHNLLICNMFN
jgi:hypothetical protein